MQYQDATVCPLSLGQARLWFQEQLHPGTCTYNVPVALRLCGRLSVPALEQSFQRVVERHEILRTAIATLDGQAVQIISPQSHLPLPIIDLSGLAGPDQEAAVRRITAEQHKRPFEFSAAPLMRALLLVLGREEHVLCLTLHHLITDGWSIGILVRDLAAFYKSIVRGEPAELPDLPVQYTDYSIWQQSMWQQSHMENGHLAEELNYWKARLEGAPAVLELPTDRPRPAVETHNGASRIFQLPSDLSRELKDLAAREHVTMFMLLLAGFEVVLHFLSGGEEDLVIGTDFAGRNSVETEHLIGFFVNQLVLRTDLSGQPSFRTLLQRVREVTLGAFAHHDMPFEKLVEVLRPVRNPKYPPLFQVKFVFQNAPETKWDFSGLTVEPVYADTGIAKFDLLLEFQETPAGIHGLFQYNTDLFHSSIADRILKHMETVMREAVSSPHANLAELERTLKEQEAATRTEQTMRLREAGLLKLANVRRIAAAAAV